MPENLSHVRTMKTHRGLTQQSTERMLLAPAESGSIADHGCRTCDLVLERVIGHCTDLSGAGREEWQELSEETGHLWLGGLGTGSNPAQTFLEHGVLPIAQLHSLQAGLELCERLRARNPSLPVIGLRCGGRHRRNCDGLDPGLNLRSCSAEVGCPPIGNRLRVHCSCSHCMDTL
jgi:hypothetical protein